MGEGTAGYPWRGAGRLPRTRDCAPGFGRRSGAVGCFARAFRADASWIDEIDWPAAGEHPAQWADEDYGKVWSRRIWLSSGLEVEMSFAPLGWAVVSPLDTGTRRVISDGCRILHDPDGFLERLCVAVRQ
jgi:hypothetical protein